MGKIKTIKLNNILNSNENPRHELGNDEIDTLKKLFDTVGFQNMLNLAEDIVKNGLVGSQKITVVYSEELSKYVVYDGNRRIAALKLLHNSNKFTFLDQTSLNKVEKIV